MGDWPSASLQERKYGFNAKPNPVLALANDKLAWEFCCEGLEGDNQAQRQLSCWPPATKGFYWAEASVIESLDGNLEQQFYCWFYSSLA